MTSRAYDHDFYDDVDHLPDRPPDAVEARAVDVLRQFFDEHPKEVFGAKHLEVLNERQFFHWVTVRALGVLADEGRIRVEKCPLSYGGSMNAVWNRGHRYPRRQIRSLVDLVEKYSSDEFTAALGNTGELLVSDGFSRFGFVQRGRDIRSFEGRTWTKSQHDLDFIFERDGRRYGVEVKNTLSYIKDSELALKRELCEHIGVVPVFVVRAAPRTWVTDLVKRGGFTLILRHQLYPLSHKALAAEVREKLGLPVDAPRALYDGTMLRFVGWHEKLLRGDL